MESELAKVDILRERFPVTYEEARNVLDSQSGDVIAALAVLEKRYPRSDRADLISIGVEMAKEVQGLLESPPITKVRVKYGNRLITETPVALSAVCALAVGIAALLISRLVIEVDRGEEDTEGDSK